MAGRVVRAGDSWEVVGAVPLADLGNRFLSHLASRGFSAATVRGYAFDLVVFASFLEERRIGVADVRGSDLFDWLDWQQRRGPGGSNVVRLGARGPAASTLNRRVAAVRGLFEYAVIVGVVSVNPVPAGRRFRN